MWKVDNWLKDKIDKSQQEFCLHTVICTIYGVRYNNITISCVFYKKKMKKIIFYGGRHNVEHLT